MHFAGTIGVVGGIQPITLGGASLDATASGGTATSPGLTIVNVPFGNSGQLAISFVDVGTVLAAQYNKSGAGFVPFSSGDTITFANGDSLLLRTTGDNAGESRTYTLTDVTKSRVVATALHFGG